MNEVFKHRFSGNSKVTNVFFHPLRYCVLLITGEEETFGSVNDAFFDFASSNTKEVLRFAYVYQRQQQPLCDTLLKKEDMRPPQV